MAHHDAQGGEQSDADNWLVIPSDADDNAASLVEGSKGQEGQEVSDCITKVLFGDDSAYKRLLTALNGIHGEVNLRLPTIVVCGSQGHGKSSTLERIALTEVFPRAEERCTRMVVRLMLRNAPAGAKKQVKLRIFNAASETAVDWKADASTPLPDIFRKTMDEFIECKHSGQRDTIDVTHELQVMIRAPDAPSIDLVDLPGIVCDNNEGASKQLTKQFLAREHTLVLVVASAADTTLSVNPVWPLVCANKNPAVVALTNVDNMPNNRNVAAILANRDRKYIPVGDSMRAVIPIVNRDNSEGALRAQCGLHEARALEDKLLREQLEKRAETFDQDRHGIVAVMRQLDTMLSEYMEKTWVRQELKKLSQTLMDLMEQLAAMGTKLEHLTPAQVMVAVEETWDTILAQPTATWRQLLDTQGANAATTRQPLGARALAMHAVLADAETNREQAMRTLLQGVKDKVSECIGKASSLPCNLARFPAVQARCAKALDEAFEAHKDAMSEDISRWTRTALQTEMLSLDGSDDCASEMQQRALVASITCKVVIGTLLGKPDVREAVSEWAKGLVPSELAESCAAERLALEAKLDLVAAAKDAFVELLPDAPCLEAHALAGDIATAIACYKDGVWARGCTTVPECPQLAPATLFRQLSKAELVELPSAHAVAGLLERCAANRGFAVTVLPFYLHNYAIGVGGCTALHFAALANRCDVAEVLIKRGGDLRACASRLNSSNRRTPAAVAALCHGMNSAIVAALGVENATQ